MSVDLTNQPVVEVALEKPAAIYLDASVLRAHNWPRPGRRLVEVLQLARSLGTRLCVPRLADIELRYVCEPETDAVIQVVKDAHLRVSKRLPLGASIPLSVPDADVFGSVYEEALGAAFAQYDLEIVRLPRVGRETVMDDAAAHRDPFAAADLQFRDSVIVLSVVERAETESLAPIWCLLSRIQIGESPCAL